MGRVPTGLLKAHNRVGSVLADLSAEDAAIVLLDYVEIMGLASTKAWSRFLDRHRKRSGIRPEPDRKISGSGAELDRKISGENPDQIRPDSACGPVGGEGEVSSLSASSPLSEADPRGNPNGSTVSVSDPAAPADAAKLILAWESGASSGAGLRVGLLRKHRGDLYEMARVQRPAFAGEALYEALERSTRAFAEWRRRQPPKEQVYWPLDPASQTRWNNSAGDGGEVERSLATDRDSGMRLVVPRPSLDAPAGIASAFGSFPKPASAGGQP